MQLLLVSTAGAFSDDELEPCQMRVDQSTDRGRLIDLSPRMEGIMTDAFRKSKVRKQHHELLCIVPSFSREKSLMPCPPCRSLVLSPCWPWKVPSVVWTRLRLISPLQSVLGRLIWDMICTSMAGKLICNSAAGWLAPLDRLNDDVACHACLPASLCKSLNFAWMHAIT